MIPRYYSSTLNAWSDKIYTYGYAIFADFVKYMLFGAKWRPPGYG